MRLKILFVCGATLLGLGLYIFMARTTLTITPWAITHTKEQLDTLELKEISRSDVNNAFASIDPKVAAGQLLVKIDIQDNQITMTRHHDKDNYFEYYKQMLTKLAKQKRLKNATFIITFHDAGDGLVLGSYGTRVPLFVFARDESKDDGQKRILMVDGLTLNYYPHDIKEIQQASKRNPWKNKKLQAYWRGGTSDGSYSESNFKTRPRCIMAQLGLQYPHLINAKFVSTPQMSSPEFEKFFITQFEIADNADKNAHMRYRYQICADGNTCTYPGFIWRLASNSITFKQKSPNTQWFYELFKPGIHYVEVANDFHDLPEKVQWANAHEEAVKKMIEAANAVASAEMTPDKILGYLVQLLNTYADRMVN